MHISIDGVHGNTVHLFLTLWAWVQIYEFSFKTQSLYSEIQAFITSDLQFMNEYFMDSVW
jgi:hypothetical protein